MDVFFPRRRCDAMPKNTEVSQLSNKQANKQSRLKQIKNRRSAHSPYFSNSPCCTVPRFSFFSLICKPVRYPRLEALDVNTVCMVYVCTYQGIRWGVQKEGKKQGEIYVWCRAVIRPPILTRNVQMHEVGRRPGRTPRPGQR